MPYKDPEAHRSYHAAYRERHRERTRAWMKAHYAENAERKKAWQKQHRRKNLEKIRAADKARYRAHRERRIAEARTYREANRDKLNAGQRANREQLRRKELQRYARDSSKKRLVVQRRRARLRGAEGVGVSAAEWKDICTRFGGLCAYCRKRKGSTIDHVVPIARGGRHEPPNVVPACKSCNSSKGTKDVCRWLKTRKPQAP